MWQHLIEFRFMTFV